jgi:hypothetical protein
MEIYMRTAAAKNANKLPAMHSDWARSQQVDIENYNVSASRLLTPARKEEIMQKNVALVA